MNFEKIQNINSQIISLKKNKKQWLFILPTDGIQGSEHIVKSLAYYKFSYSDECNIIILTKKKSGGWEAAEKTMKVTYFPFSSYFMGILYLIPYLLLNYKYYNTIDYTFTSQTIINGMIGFGKRIGLLDGALVILRESNSIFDLLKGIKLKIYTFFYRLGYKESHLVICQTDYMKQQLIDALPKLSSQLNLQVIPNPFSFDDISKKSGAVIPELENKQFLVAAGRLAPAKGFDILIESFNQLTKHNDELCLVILGEGKDRAILQNRINELNLTEKIYMPGYVQNVYSYFKKAEVCVLSSRIEGFPNVLLQMMSQNTKIVATLCAGGIEEIPKISTCQTNSVDDLVIAIEKILDENTDAYRTTFDNYLSKRTLHSFSEMIIKNLNNN